MTYAEDEREITRFAEEAAKWFAKNKINRSYTRSGDLRTGELLAMRWGLDDDCVVVIRIGGDEPVNYQNLVSSYDIPF